MTTKKPNAVKRMKVSAEETKQIPIIEERLLGRDKLFNQIFTAIMSFTKNNLELKRELSLYICGKPGTGKTFTVEKVIKEFGLRKKSIFSGIIQLNAMEMNTPNDIFKIICQNLTSKSELKSRSLEAKAYKSIADSKNFTLLVIDEFESLTSRFNKESVIKIFMMPKATNGKLILISISNQVGMPDLLMPQLDSRNCTPDVIVFPPYTKQELIEIIMQKLPGEKNTLALEYCARQVEKFGDVRQALDICKNSMQDGKIELKSTIRTATN